MQKQFTVRIPDELYVPGFTTNTWSTYTYNGPDIVTVTVNTIGDVFNVVNDQTQLPSEGSLDVLVDIDAATYPEVAHFLLNTGTDHVYEYVDEINHDGSIHKKMLNPRLQDVYRLRYNLGATNDTTSDDGHTHGPWHFQIITKDRTTNGEMITKQNLDLVVSNLSTIGLDTQTQTDYNTFVVECDNYLTTMANIFPWKYVNITSPAVPKLPISLVNAINQVKAAR